MGWDWGCCLCRKKPPPKPIRKKEELLPYALHISLFGLLFGLGNPLLDISAVVDTAFLEEYGLQPDTAVIATTDKQKGMVEVLKKNYVVTCVPGGAAQNALRVAQWVLRQPRVTVFMGAVGIDEDGKLLEEIVTKDGVIVRYKKVDGYPTGTCTALVTGWSRTLCVNGGAVEHFTKDFLARPENMALIDFAEFFYISGFFLLLNPESTLTVAQHAFENDKVLVMSFSADYVARLFTDELVSHVDILIGNQRELEAFADVRKIQSKLDVIALAKMVAASPKSNSGRPRVVVITQGIGNVIVVRGKDPQVQEYPVMALPTDQVWDTQGAGDAFVGGFLAKLVKGKDIEECVKTGIYVAKEICKLAMCSIPEGRKVSGRDSKI